MDRRSNNVIGPSLCQITSALNTGFISAVSQGSVLPKFCLSTDMGLMLFTIHIICLILISAKAAESETGEVPYFLDVGKAILFTWSEIRLHVCCRDWVTEKWNDSLFY